MLTGTSVRWKGKGQQRTDQGELVVVKQGRMRYYEIEEKARGLYSELGHQGITGETEHIRAELHIIR